MEEGADKSFRGRIARVWKFLWRPNTRIPFAVLIIAGAFLGILFWGGFNLAMEASNTEAFCISCHEMRDNVYQELQQTIHWKNRSGVRAICSDCHVPRAWIHKVYRKVEATNELFHKIVGTINTKEKFEAHRLQLAQDVWTAMKKTDSRECRNCHAVDSMDPHKQSAAAQIMFEAVKNGMTCIDCHKGIAHRLPEEPEEPEEPAKSESK